MTASIPSGRPRRRRAGAVVTGRPRRLVVALAASALVLTLAGCVPLDGRTYPNATDLARASRIWNDRWLAPTRTQVVESVGRVGLPELSRDVGGRRYLTTAAPADAVVAEVRAAQASGWVLTGVTCDTAEDSVRVSLATGGVDPDSAAIAGIQTYRWSEFSLPATATGSDQVPADRIAEVVIWAEVPHHLDQGWPDPEPIALDDTCLVGGTVSVPAAQPDLPQAPMDAAGAGITDLDDPTTKVQGWKSTEPTAQERDAVEMLSGDKTLTNLGITLSEGGAQEATGARGSPEGTSPARAVPTDRLARTVKDAAADGWMLTYASCTAGDDLLQAELRRTLSDDITATLRLTLVADPATPGQGWLTAAAVAGSRSLGAAPAVSAATVRAPCWSATDGADAPFTATGTPWFGPTRMAPLQDG